MPSAAIPTLLANHRPALRAVQLACLCSTLIISISWSAAILSNSNPDYRVFIPLFLFSPLWLAPLWPAWQLREKDDVYTIKKALLFAIGWAIFATPLLLFGAILAALDEALWGAAILLLVAAPPVCLLIFSWRLYRLLREYDMDRYHLRNTVVFAAVLILVPVAGVSLLFSTEHHPMYESSAVGSLRSLRIAQDEYAHAHPKQGFATSLAQLGPPPGTGLIDGALASGKKAKYVYVLKFDSSDITAPITLYSVTATPEKFKSGTLRSFYMDQSGTIRYTIEKRPATAQDASIY